MMWDKDKEEVYITLNHLLLAWVLARPYRLFNLSSYVVEGEMRAEVILEQRIPHADHIRIVRGTLTKAIMYNHKLLKPFVERLFLEFERKP